MLTRRQRRTLRGLTLVELMVGLTLGMMLSAALLTLLSTASSIGSNLKRSSLLIENARYTAELLRDDLQLAGFWGELETSAAAYTTPDPCSTGTDGWVAAPLGLPSPVRGYGADEVLACPQSRRAGTSALAVRRLEVASTPAATPLAGGTQDFLQPSFCTTDPSSQPFQIGHDPAAFTLRARNCTAASPLRGYVRRLYFIASCNRCGNGGDSTPTLKRLDVVNGGLTETSLVEGVEELRFEYGFDTDNDGSVDSWLMAAGNSGAAARWENVVALKVHFVVRSPDRAIGDTLGEAQTFVLGGTGTLTAPVDGYVRRAYSTTVRLINPSAAREVQ